MILTCMQCALVSVNRNTICGPPYGPESAMPKNCLLMLTGQCGCAAAPGAAVALAMPSRPAAPAATATAAPRRAALPRGSDMRMNFLPSLSVVGNSGPARLPLRGDVSHERAPVGERGTGTPGNVLAGES